MANVGESWRKTGSLCSGSVSTFFERFQHAFEGAKGSPGRAPDFVIIGAQKCATTNLAHHLSMHPDVGLHTYCAPGASLETHYFSREYAHKSLAWYRRGFPEEPRLVGEKSPDYYMNPQAMRRLEACAPDAKLILLVRDPVDRFLSARSMRLRANPDQDLSAQACLSRWDLFEEYILPGCYDYHIERSLSERQRANLIVINAGDDYAQVHTGVRETVKVKGLHGVTKPAAARGVWSQACQFLDIDPHAHRPDYATYVNKKKTALSVSERGALTEFYQSRIMRRESRQAP